MLNKNAAIKILKDTMEAKYKEIATQPACNVFRGNLRSLSTDVEDAIAVLISNIILDDYKLFVDTNITINKKNNRPDILVINNKNEVKLMLEVKVNMGYCRDANDVIKKLKNKDKSYQSAKTITCSFSQSRHSKETLQYNSPKLILVSFDSGNCSTTHKAANLATAKANGVKFYNLFNRDKTNALTNCDIDVFCDFILENI